VRFPCRKSPEPPLRRGPKSGVGPAGMVTIVAFSDGVDRKTKNNLVTVDRTFLLVHELFASLSISPCTVGKWAVSITFSTCC
jgi:hypothetical protein